MHGAHEVNIGSTPNVLSVIEQSAANAKLAIGRVYFIGNKRFNAFATVRDLENTAIEATTGPLEHFNTNEGTGVIALKLAHFANPRHTSLHGYT